MSIYGHGYLSEDYINETSQYLFEGYTNQVKIGIKNVLFGSKYNKVKNTAELFKKHENPYLLKLVSEQKEVEDLQYLKKDWQTAKSTLNKIIKRLTIVENEKDAADNPKYKSWYKGIKKQYVDKGCTSKDVKLYMEWGNTVYIKAINDKIKELKSK